MCAKCFVLIHRLTISVGSDENESPSKITSTGQSEELLSLTTQSISGSANATVGSSKGSSPRRVFSKSTTHKRSPGKRRGRSPANATFLTDCSFGVAHDQLVQVITDVQPFEPHWEGLSCIDLSGRKLESVARLKEFLPRLDSLQLCASILVPRSLLTLFLYLTAILICCRG